MKTFLPILSFLALALVNSLPAATQPSLSLKVFFSNDALHSGKDPLLASLRVGNPGAADLQARNRQAGNIFRAYRDSGAFDKMDSAEVQRLRLQYAIHPLPLLQVHSSPLVFEAWIEGQAPVALAARPARSHTPWPPQAVLDGTTILTGDWILTIPENSPLRKSPFHLKASIRYSQLPALDLQNAESNHVRIRPTGDSRQDRFQMEVNLARLFLKDAEWDKAVQRAEAALELEAKSIEAWILRGDIEMARQRWAEAEVFFRKALDLVRGSWLQQKMRSLFPLPNDEEPEYLLRRLGEAQTRQRKSP